MALLAGARTCRLARALVVLAMLLTASRDADAKGLKCKPKQDIGFGFVEGFATMLGLPPLVVNGSDAPRRLVGVPTPAASDSLFGFGFGLQIRCSYFVDDLFSFRYSAAFTGGASGTTSADDTLVNASRGGVQLIDLGVPIFGLPTGFQVFAGDANEWKISLKLDFGVEHTWATATVSGAGVAPTSASMDSWDPYVRAQVGACRRIAHDISDLSAWGCVTISPVLYERSPLPGVSAGLRVDL